MPKRISVQRLISVFALVSVMFNVGITSASDNPTQSQAVNAQVWITTGDQKQLLQPQAPIAFAADSGSNAVTIDVDESNKFQTMDGFGAALTDSAAWLIWTRLLVGQREELMHKLFDSKTGIGLRLLRHAIGTSDLSLSNYTYDDLPTGQTDPQLTRFSIGHDLDYILPLLNEARSLNSSLQVIGTPWSPPAWMKTSGSLIGGSLRPDAYETYARYLVRYLQDYSAQGVSIVGITPQNEPLFTPAGSPGALMSVAEETDFIKQYLGPELARAGLDTHIIIYDHNWDHPEYPLAVMSDPGARPFVTGTGFHCYAGGFDAQTPVHDRFPDKGIWVTECSGTVGSEFATDLRWLMHNLFIGAVRTWAKGVLLWNLALDKLSGPQNGGCVACRGVVTIDPLTGATTYNVEYYALGQASVAVDPGAQRVASNTFDGGIETVAFLNPDGSKALLVLNNGNTETLFKVRWAGLAFSYSLPAGAAGTFKWP
jgi:glucosylceramidase